MKRLSCALSAVICLAVLNLRAASISHESLAFRNQVEQFLQEEGFKPTIDSSDDSVCFKYEGESFWLTVQNKGPYYIELHIAGFTVENTNRSYILAACNYANRNQMCGKAYLSSDSLKITVEFYCMSFSSFKSVFYQLLSSAKATKKAVKDCYDDLDDE